MTNTVSTMVSDEILNAIMQIESGGKPGAANPLSTAVGLAQFIKSTWLETVRKHRPDVAREQTQSTLLAMRTNPSFAIEMLARLTEDNLKIIGRNAQPGDIYLAHFSGAETARRLMQYYPQNAKATEVFSPAAARANPSIIPGKTIAQVREWANNKMAKAQRQAGNYVKQYYRGKLVGGTGVAADIEFSSVDKTRPGLAANGDAKLWDNQAQLKSMNYSPGLLDGRWGGGTSGALAAFFTDRGVSLAIPANKGAYDANYIAIDSVIDKAEAEGWTRPVTRAREEAAPEVVEEVAPEIVPAKKGFWASVAAFGSAASATAWEVWGWLTGYSDHAREWGLFSFIGEVPRFVWLLAACGVTGYIVYATVKTVRGIQKPVTTGERM